MNHVSHTNLLARRRLRQRFSLHDLLHPNCWPRTKLPAHHVMHRELCNNVGLCLRAYGCACTNGICDAS
jgi:hypothetical protein